MSSACRRRSTSPSERGGAIGDRGPQGRLGDARELEERVNGSQRLRSPKERPQSKCEMNPKLNVKSRSRGVSWSFLFLFFCRFRCLPPWRQPSRGREQD